MHINPCWLVEQCRRTIPLITYMTMWELEDKEQMMCAIRVHLPKCVWDRWTWCVWICDPQSSQANELLSLMSPVVCTLTIFSWVKTQCGWSVYEAESHKGFFLGGLYKTPQSLGDNYLSRSATQWMYRNIVGCFSLLLPVPSNGQSWHLQKIKCHTFSVIIVPIWWRWLTNHTSVIRFTNR